MKIIKSSYSAEQLYDFYNSALKKVDPHMAKKVRIFKRATVEVLFALWGAALIYGIWTDKLNFILGSVGISLLIFLIYHFEEYINLMFLEYYEKKGIYPYNYLDATMMPEYINTITQSEKLVELQDKGRLSLIRKGEEQIILFTDAEGKEETYPLACPVKENNGTLDFSSLDNDIKELMELKFWKEPKAKKQVKEKE